MSHPWLRPLLLSLSRNLPFHAARRRAASALNPDELPAVARFRTADGIVLELYPRDELERQIFLYGYAERNSVRWFRRLIRRGMTVVDAGAAVGQYTLLASRRVGATGSVHSFEPHPGNFRALLRNLELNPSLRGAIRLNHAGLGNERGLRTLHDGPEGNRGMSSLVLRIHPDVASNEVPIVPLDEYAEEANLTSVDVLKLDVEGSELQVLRGAERLLARRTPMAILCELNPIMLSYAGSSPEEIVDYLRGFGFRGFVPRAFPLPLTPLRALPPDTIDNVLFLRP